MKKIFTFIFSLFLLIGLPANCEEEVLHHWDNLKSIKVYIPPKHENTTLMKKAFNEWEKASKGRIRFLYVSSPNYAQNVVVFNDMFSGNELGETATKGQTICNPIYKRVDGVLREICDDSNTREVKTVKIITIATKNPNSYEKRKNYEIYSTMLHEIGHSLGLPHSDDPKDLMYFQEHKGGAKGITENDVKALYAIYGWNY